MAKNQLLIRSTGNNFNPWDKSANLRVTKSRSGFLQFFSER